jgi:hypothetical protein
MRRPTLGAAAECANIRPEWIWCDDFDRIAWPGISSGPRRLLVTIFAASTSWAQVFDASHVGSWYCIEARVRLNDAGLSNGRHLFLKKLSLFLFAVGR